MKATPDPQLGRLRSAFEFTAQDLRQNRRGRLTAAQIERLGRRRWQAFRATQRPLGWTTLLSVLVGAGLHHVLAAEHPLSLWEVGAFAGFLLLGLVPWATTLTRQLLLIYHLSRDLSRRRAEPRSGPLSKDTEQDRRAGERLFAEVGGLRFEVADRDSWELLQPGVRYRVHIAPRSEVVLSLEPADHQP